MDERETCTDEQDTTCQCDRLCRDISQTANSNHHLPYKRAQAPTRADDLSKGLHRWGSLQKETRRSPGVRQYGYPLAYSSTSRLGEAKRRIKEGEYQRHISHRKADARSYRSMTDIPRLHLYMLPLSPHARGPTRRRQITMRHYPPPPPHEV